MDIYLFFFEPKKVIGRLQNIDVIIIDEMSMMIRYRIRYRTELGNLPSYLDLSNNAIDGEIPSSLRTASHLIMVDLHHIMLVDVIPF